MQLLRRFLKCPRKPPRVLYRRQKKQQQFVHIDRRPKTTTAHFEELTDVADEIINRCATAARYRTWIRSDRYHTWKGRVSYGTYNDAFRFVEKKRIRGIR